MGSFLGPCYLLTHAVCEKKEAKQKIVIQEIINRYCAGGYHFTVTTNLQSNSLRYICFPCLRNLGQENYARLHKKPRLPKRKKKCFWKTLGPMELTYKKEIRITGNPTSQTNKTKHMYRYPIGFSCDLLLKMVHQYKKWITKQKKTS